MAGNERQIGRATLLQPAESRLTEAQVLLASGQYSGACYLAGYAAELQLKAHISDKLNAGVIPDPRFVE